MANYDFSTLNSTDFEELICDLLNAKEPSNSKIHYKTFKDGKDKGIDFLYSSENKQYNHVGQVKHFYRTGYSGLYSTLKSKEVDKAKKLNPNKYLLATSVDLSVYQTEQIKNLFQPFIKSLNDIYGKKDINRLLEIYDTVLKDYYKLWFSDTSVLKLILNSDLEFKSTNFIEYELKKRIRIFVKTDSFEKARLFLNQNKFIVITGEPGVGKTTLAEMLCYEFIMNEFKLTYIEEIAEADRVLSKDSSKQIIYFDDFLGSNKVEINKAKGSESKLRRVLRNIPKMENKFLILTTRTFLLDTAITESENLRKFNIKANESTVQLQEYTTELKEQLIKNHIEDSNLNDEFKSIFSVNLITHLVNHKYFTPRGIEYITQNNLQLETKEEFENFVYKSFNSPDRIWNHAFYEQISETDRIFLSTLLSFWEKTSITSLKQAFNKRYNIEVKENNIEYKTNAFKQVFKRLTGGFLKSQENQVDFINPSLKDFLTNEIFNNFFEVERTTLSVVSLEQLKTFSKIYKKNNREFPTVLKKYTLSIDENFFYEIDNDVEHFYAERLYYVTILSEHFDINQVEDKICEILNGFEDWVFLSEDYELGEKFRYFISKTYNNLKIRFFINENIIEIIEGWVLDDFDIESVLDSLNYLFSLYSDIIDLDFKNDKIKLHISDLLESKIIEEVDFLKETINYEGEEDELIIEINNLIEKVDSLGFELNISNGFYDVDWSEIAFKNNLTRMMLKD